MRDDYFYTLRRRARRAERKRRHDLRSLIIFIALAFLLFGWRAVIRNAGGELARRQVAQMGLTMTERGPAWQMTATLPAAAVASPEPDRASAVTPRLRPPAWILSEQMYRPADPDRIGPWTWARQYNLRRDEEEADG